jgi:glucose-6-phosphate isomerase
MEYSPGFNISPTYNPMGFEYGADCFGPPVENRHLEDIRRSLADPYCSGPDVVYSIAMDVGKKIHKETLQKLHILFGVVMYAAGKLGREPIKSQGHIHKVSPKSGWSTPEVYEIWNGEAVIYMQETANDDPGRCFAVYAKPGEVVIVPPGWAHATISVNPEIPLIFGAWCDRAYGFEYEDVRKHKGLAWFPIIGVDNKINWIHNTMYQASELICKVPNEYPDLGICKGEPIYETFEKNPDTFLYVPEPGIKASVWKTFEP